MANNDDEREFRLRPRKPRAPSSRNDGVVSTPAFKMLMHYARQSRSGRAQKSAGSKPVRSHRQRCAVRITYSKNATRGQWRAHGRYLERESAADGELGFNAGETGAEISTALRHWQGGGRQAALEVHHLSGIRRPRGSATADTRPIAKDGTGS